MSRRVSCGFRLILSLVVLVSVSHSDEPDLWSLSIPKRLKPPAADGLRFKDRIRNEIDHFILRSLEAEGLKPAPAADATTLVRRAYFDLLGLPPSPEQVDAFVKDKRPDAWERLVDSLLKSPHYGERWGRHWLDVARYADSGGYETDIYYRNAWRYRDYVVKSFNDDKPYNIFVQEQIAGDEIWPDNLDLDPRKVYIVPEKKLRHFEARTGTGFYTLGPRVHESALDAKRLAYETMTDWVDTTASAFMGLTLACSRCHDHKFDPFTQQDYFSLQAIFASAKELEVPMWNAMGEHDWRQSFPRVLAVKEARKAYRLFETRTGGRKLTKEEEARKQQLLAAIGSAVLALPERTGGPTGTIPYDALMHSPTVRALGRKHPALIKPTFVLERGELSKPKERVAPALPAALAKITKVTKELKDPFAARKELAQWLTRKDHPLTARVMVNRIWLWHFGKGIVETPNDFGLMGASPSHPDLLDWLAVRFVDAGWRIKDMHRLIMNSAAYRQSSNVGDTGSLTKDADNRLLWRMNRRRLEGEALWDAVHSAAGTINLEMGGPPVAPPLSGDEIASLRDRWHWVVSADPKQHTRRGIYILVRRNFAFPMFEVFDAPVTAVSCPVRDVTTVATQALWGLNNPTVFKQATLMADRVAKKVGKDQKKQVQFAWRIALGRKPSDEELSSAVDLLKQLEATSVALADPPPTLKSWPPKQAQALAKLCHALFNLSEFAFVD